MELGRALKERIEEIEKELGYMDSGREAEALGNALEIINELQAIVKKLKNYLKAGIKIVESLEGENEMLKANLKWKPIESAPKDIDVLIFDPNEGIKKAQNCGSGWSCHDGWCVGPYCSPSDYNPTYWMPLPEKPSH